MNIAIIFHSNFDIISAFEGPMGGSESAVTYLSIELVKRGHKLTLYTSKENPRSAFGVAVETLKILNNQIIYPMSIQDNTYDLIILKNGLPEIAMFLKKALNKSSLFYFWTGHDTNQKAVQNLSDSGVVAAIDRFICVSNWQKQKYINTFNINPYKLSLLRNAISWFFENLYTDFDDFLASKSKTPTLVYTSTPFRGLDILLQVFKKINLNQTAQLKVFSSMKVYGISEQEDTYKYLYQLSKKIPNIEYKGSLPQIKLAHEVSQAHILSYPSTFAETSCIAVMEAMAAGLQVVTTKLGALEETTANFGSLIEYSDQLNVLCNAFINQLSIEIDKIKQNKTLFFEKLYEQIIFMNQHHTWKCRALSFEKLVYSDIEKQDQELSRLSVSNE